MTALRVERKDRVVLITIDRPPVNALTAVLCDDLRRLFSDLPADNDLCCVILTGAGTRAFCAGLDFGDFLEVTDDEQPAKAAAVSEMYSSVYHCPVPTIAAVNGPALGAGSVLASVCDIRIASPNASFGLPEINVGRIGGAAHHGRLVSQGALRRLVFTGAPVSSHEAYRIGLVDQLSPDDAVTTANEVATVICTKSPLGLRRAKQSLNEIEGRPFEDGYRLEQAANAAFRRTAAAREAARAILEKRAPDFGGN